MFYFRCADMIVVVRCLPTHSDRVTHVVSEQNQPPGLWAWLRGRGLNDLSTLHVLDISWFTDSMREGRPVTLEARHRIQVTDNPPPVTSLTYYRYTLVYYCYVSMLCARVWYVFEMPVRT